MERGTALSLIHILMRSSYACTDAVAAHGQYARYPISQWHRKPRGARPVSYTHLVRHGLVSIMRETEADEIMVNGQIFDHQARLHSFDLAMQVKEELLG